MSTLTQRQQGAVRRSGRESSSPAASKRRPYFVINGATMVAIAAIALTIIGILYLVQTSEVAQLGYDMSRLQTQRDALTLEISELEYEVARFESLHTVEEVATSRLGMTPMMDYEFLERDIPAQRDLVIPEPAEATAPSLFDRIVDAVLGVGSAESQPVETSGNTGHESSP